MLVCCLPGARPTVVLLFSDVCKAFRVPPPPAPPPKPVPTVQDLIEARRAKFNRQRRTQVEAVASAKERTTAMRKGEWEVGRQNVLDGRATLRQNASICLGNATRHAPIVLGQD
eukprot:SAG22_NODE_70_length_22717_cov_12.413741_5_plen_114_part_00